MSFSANVTGTRDVIRAAVRRAAGEAQVERAVEQLAAIAPADVELAVSVSGHIGTGQNHVMVSVHWPWTGKEPKVTAPKAAAGPVKTTTDETTKVPAAPAASVAAPKA